MEKNFIRVHSVKDIIVRAALMIAGAVLVALPTSESLNILGFFMIFAGLILIIFMQTGYKEEESGDRYSKKEIFFDKSMRPNLSKVVAAGTCGPEIKESDGGNGIRLDIYHSKASGKVYLQLFEYVPYKYEPCTEMYEHSYDNLAEILK